jgi:hypothetical protein
MVIGQGLEACGIDILCNAISDLRPARRSDEKRSEKKKRRLEVRPVFGLEAE